MPLNRRRFLLAGGACGLALLSPGWLSAKVGAATVSASELRHSGVIPATGEVIPAIGMGTWITFNVGGDEALIAQRTEVLKTFLELGGTMIDGSPMYGSSNDVIGEALATLDARDRVFSATKIWTGDGSETREQAESSERRWGVPAFDLLQVHNLLAWRDHLNTLKAMKAEGEVRYIGITTSHGRRHGELAQIMANEPLDFIQITYNLIDREVEDTLLPLAQERGIAVLVNRPFQGGRLFSRYESEPLPPWAGDIGCRNWAEFFLKFVIAHPAVTCAIPATSKVAHMRENMGAMTGPLPDERQRQRMADYVAQL